MKQTYVESAVQTDSNWLIADILHTVESNGDANISNEEKQMNATKPKELLTNKADADPPVTTEAPTFSMQNPRAEGVRRELNTIATPNEEEGRPVCLAVTVEGEDNNGTQSAAENENLLNLTSEREELIEMQKTDSATAEIYSILEQLQLPNSSVGKTKARKTRQHCLKDGLLIHKENEFERIVIPTSFKKKVMILGHTHKLCGHFGIRRTLDRIKLNYYWRGMSTDIKRFVRGCTTCAEYKPDKGKPKGFLQSQVHEKPWANIFVDFIGPLVRSSKNNTYLLVFQDGFTRACELAAVRNASAQTVAKALFNQVICRYGIPERVYSDNASSFRSELFKETCKLMDMQPCTVIAYKPSSNRVERCNQDLLRLIAISARNKHTAWDDYISEIQFSFNCARNVSTGYSPFFLNFFREARLPLLATDPLDSDNQHHVENLPQYVKHLAEKVPKVFEETRKNVAAATNKYAKYYNQNRANITYEVGDHVFDKTHYQSSAPNKFMKKLAPLYIGPFIVSKKINDVSYVISDPCNMKTVGTRHITQLKQFHPNSDLTDPDTDSDPSSSELENLDEEASSTSNSSDNLSQHDATLPHTNLHNETSATPRQHTAVSCAKQSCSSTWCTYDGNCQADIQCRQCSAWFHNVCAGVFNNDNPDFRCRACL